MFYKKGLGYELEYVDDNKKMDIIYFWTTADCAGIVTEVTQCAETVDFDMNKDVALTSISR